jgi:hypothetical protein
MTAGPHLAKLSYEAAVRALDVQERSIEQLRARAGVLLATASVTASFLGAQTIQHASGLGVLEVLALVSLAATIASCTYVLLPKQGFVFSLRGVRMFEMLYEIAHDEEAEEVDRRLVYWLDEYWESNQDKIEDLGRYFFAAAVALVLQFSFWSWALADIIH